MAANDPSDYAGAMHERNHHGLSWFRSPRPVLYLKLDCLEHGEIRLAIEDDHSPVPTLRTCPLCHQVCWAELLGKGATTKKLPFYEQMPGNGNNRFRLPGSRPGKTNGLSH